MIKGRLTLLAAAALAAGLCVPAQAVAAPAAQAAPAGRLAAPLQRTALATPRAQRAVTLGITRAGQRLVAVGERGIVLLSDDNAASWRQAKVPVSVTLTAVRFANARTGWAVGHAGLVLRTQDGGENWERQLDGDAINALLGKPDAQRTTAQEKRAQQFVQDGPDKPLLDLHVRSANDVFVVGAYGLALRTTDGGATWASWMDRFDNPKGLHLNAIDGRGDMVVVVGEQGLVQRSSDGGERFTPAPTPYNGSFFAVAVPKDGSIFVAGLRGQAFRASDGGSAFVSMPLPAPVTVNAMAVLDDGGIVLGNQAGMVFGARTGSAGAAPTVASLDTQARQVPLLSGLAVAPDGALVAVGAYGPVRFHPGQAK